jgi:hypothetical protein
VTESEIGSQREHYLLASVVIIVKVGEELCEYRYGEVEESFIGKERRDMRIVITKSIENDYNPIQFQIVPHEEMKCWTR